MSLVSKQPLPVAALVLLTAAVPLGRPERPPVAPQVACSSLASMNWGGFAVEVAEVRPAGDGSPAHCFVRGTVDTEIDFELLLPRPADWNGRFVMGGGGGFVGSIDNQALAFASPVARGYATVGTDAGHDGASAVDARWALNRVDREVNFGYRAVHVVADAAKAIIRLHYGRDIDNSYFLGCSNGGRQAMMESQRYPDDFDGIVAGAPAYDFTPLLTKAIQIQQAMYPDPDELRAPVVTADARRLLANRFLEACDEEDGVADGIVSHPRDCDFEPEELPRCSADDGDCLTPGQLEALRRIYRPLRVGDDEVYPGFPYGAETAAGGWQTWVTGGENAIAPGVPSLQYGFGTQFFRYMAFDDPEWDHASYDLSRWAADTREIGRFVDATDPDLTAFRVAGGKLILWHGWADPAISARSTVDYLEDVRKEHTNSSSFVRLFLLPGVLHCGGGPGPAQVDWLGAIRGWVEDGQSPERLIATRRDADGEVEMRRPVCAYPDRAVYDGEGDARREDAFSCAPGSGSD